MISIYEIVRHIQERTDQRPQPEVHDMCKVVYNLVNVKQLVIIINKHS